MTPPATRISTGEHSSPSAPGALSPSASNLRSAFWAAGLVGACLQAWCFRHTVTPDAISYLDIAWNCVRGNWHSLINGYWSPLYPFLLGVVFRVFRPSPYWESTVAHLTNVGIFLFAFVCFEFLIASLIREHYRDSQDAPGREPLPSWALWALGDGIFVCYALLFNSLAEVHPDLLVEGLVFLAAALLVRIRTGDTSYGMYAAFGVVLGLSYLAKEVMFPVSFVFLGCCLLMVKPFWKSVPRTAVAILCFALIAAPFIWKLSGTKGRFTFGDTGKIAYAEFVDGAARYVHWQGGPRGVGRPIHPTHEILTNPPVFVFATPVGGTYPPWYDPSYWYDGIVPVFKLKNQLRAIRYTIQEYVGILPYMGGLLVGFLGLALSAGPQRAVWRDVMAQWPLWIPPVAALGLYALVYVEARLVGAFLILAWVSLFAALRFSEFSGASALKWCVTLATVITLCVGIGWTGARSLFRALAPKPFVNWQVAEGLRALGVKPGDEVASIGDSLNAYWAHLAGVRIIAEIPLGGRDGYWASPPQIQSEVLTDFAKAGAKVAVTDLAPPRGMKRGWQRIGQTNYGVHILSTDSVSNEAGK